VSTSEGVFLTLLVSGILVLVGSLMLTRLHWCKGIAPYGRRTHAVHVLLHPEQYTADAPLRVIRSLSFTGVLLLTGAVAVLVCELVRLSVGR
jgi:hypothetical protein